MVALTVPRWSAGLVRCGCLNRRGGWRLSLGCSLEEASTGGGSDGNFTAALGVPTLDGMGAVGAGAHAAHEHVIAGCLVERTALLAGMIAGVGLNIVGWKCAGVSLGLERRSSLLYRQGRACVIQGFLTARFALRSK